MTRGTLGKLAAAAAMMALASGAEAATLLRGPYLQSPTPGSMVVRWRTDVATPSRVSHGAAPGSLTTIVDDPAAVTEHVVTVSSLSPDTAYYYAVGSDTETLAGDDADHVFRTAPTPGPARPTRIWVTGDGGFANANGMAVRDAYATFAAGAPTDLWLLLGDNAYLLGTDADYQAALFDMHQDLLLRTPAWPAFGNHEAFSSNSLTQTGPFFDMFTLPTAGQAGGVPSGSEVYFSWDFANVHFVMLDSEHNLKTPGSPMLTWLEADLQATTADWVVALWHRPPYSKGLLHDSDVEAGEIDMRVNILPVLESYGVDLVLCGHSHNYERSYLLDGHYGLSGTFSSAFQVDPGDGNPAGDGAYRKDTVGMAPHEGAVYAVAGSSSEVRPATLNHPAMRVGLLELGSMVIDVDGLTLDATFLNSLGQQTDRFQIVKGTACPPSPRPGCIAGGKGKLILKNNPTDTKDLAVWAWKAGALDATALGAPQNQGDLAVCMWDQNGNLIGGALPHGTPWTASGSGTLKYLDLAGTRAGWTKIRARPGIAPKGKVIAKGKGANLALPALPVTLPVTAQLLNLDGSACWQSVFASAKANDGTKVVALTP